MNRMPRLKLLLLSAACLVTVAPMSFSTEHASSARREHMGVYAPYAFLIGEWEMTPEGAAQPVAVTRFSWGLGGAYILMSTSLIRGGREEPHFEGMLMWNGVHKHLDMLVALDPHGGRAQEQGRMYKQEDGVVVREIAAYYSEGARTPDGAVVGARGASARFRQTFAAVGPDKVKTSLMRKGPDGWTATFPGSDKAVMMRRGRNAAAH
jgi:hypothetical protein